MERRSIKVSLAGVDAQVLYHKYLGFDVNTMLVAFESKRRVLSTSEGFKNVKYVANSHHPDALSAITMLNYAEFEENFPPMLGVTRDDLVLLSTGANMDNLAVCEQSYKDLTVCCLATGGVGNGLRSGVDKGHWLERDGRYVNTLGTINIFVLTNTPLTDGAMARAVITGTEAKTAALQDMDARSSLSPQLQATGTGTDNMVVVSGVGCGGAVTSTGGHTKIGELIGVATKIVVAETIKRHEISVGKARKTV
ncbi:MAG: adenosylcobinamide amidohydrolase [Candidatus Bathyarchaeia archaeon]|jgi:adenosylcobinamide amidohydrolase